MNAPGAKLLFSNLKFSSGLQKMMKEFLSHPNSTILTYLKIKKLNADYALGTVLFISVFPVSKTELLP